MTHSQKINSLRTRAAELGVVITERTTYRGVRFEALWRGFVVKTSYHEYGALLAAVNIASSYKAK